MGKFVLKNVVVEVDGEDLSDHISSATFDTPDDEVDSTAFGPSGFKETMKGLSDATITVTFQQDFDVGSVDDTLWPLKLSDAPFSLRVKPKGEGASPTNPAYTMAEALLFNYSPLGGSVGELSTTEVSFRNAGSGGVERIVS